VKTFRSIPTIILAGCVAVTAPCLGQQSTSAAGEYVGASGPIHFKLHLVSAPNGLLSGTVDSPEQNAYGLPLGDIHVTGQSLSFSVPSVRGSWVGFISADGNSLSGTYSQGNAFPLNFARAGAPTSVSAGPSLPNAGPPIASAADCPRNSLANYWDGNSWKSLKQVVALPRERGVSILGALSNPLNPGAGNTTIYRYKGASADI